MSAAASAAAAPATATATAIPTMAAATTTGTSTSSKVPSNLSASEVEELIATRLRNYVKGCSAPFTCGGSLLLDEPPSVTLLEEGTKKKKGEAIVVQTPNELREGKLRRYDYAKNSYNQKAKNKRAELFERQASDLQGLISNIPRAPFGKGGETVYDTTVRDALQLKAEHFELGIPQDKIDSILKTIESRMDLQTSLVAEPYSLNVYQEGGKFAKHKDTPRGDDMLGTLVIRLPTWFTGGTMSVSLGEETKTYFGGERRYSWEEPDQSPPQPRTIEWCAFFADVDHEIHRVQEGVRITAAYLLRRKDHASASSFIPRPLLGQEQADRIKDAFLEGLRDERFLAHDGKIGFPCLHLYTNTEVFPGKADSTQALTPTQIGKLKGRDLMIANAAAAAGLPVRLLPYLGHDYSGDGDGDYPLAKFPNKKKCPRRMCDDKIKTFFKTDDSDRGSPESSADLWILDFDAAKKAKAGQTEWNADGYFGNEASWISFYVKACLIIEVPEYSASRGVPVQVSPPKKKRKTTPKPSATAAAAASTPASSSAAKVVVTPTSASTTQGFASGTYDLETAVHAQLAVERASGVKVTPEDVKKICATTASAMASRLANELNGTTSSSSTSMSASGQKRSAASAWSDLLSSQSGGKATPAATAKFDAAAAKKRLLKRTTTEVKKTAHNDRKKPYSTVSDALPDESAARALFEDVTPSSDTKAMIKWKLSGMEVSNWFKNDSSGLLEHYIHPVKFDGKVICLFGSKPKVYAWAGFDSVEVKFEKKSNLLTLKIRTYLAGTGRPDKFGGEDLTVPPYPNRRY
mmetsp:Transcript_5491/g.11966  ORF Transcript_5491/g.11966 Transcript_5491/m.11966 type:complete len:805 (-) Transcript_5491:127-2541(-)